MGSSGILENSPRLPVANELLVTQRQQERFADRQRSKASGAALQIGRVRHVPKLTLKCQFAGNS
jgi:hypothetical protein